MQAFGKLCVFLFTLNPLLFRLLLLEKFGIKSYKIVIPGQVSRGIKTTSIGKIG